MNIGIIFHSQTGHTNSVAEKLKEKLLAAGHSVNLEKLEFIGELRSDTRNVQFKSFPNIDEYDALVLGSPVQGFALSPVMASYLTHIKSLQNKKVACLLTQFFPFPSMGGNQALDQLKKICESKGAVICGTAIINWSNLSRNKKISESVDKLSSIF